MSAELVRLLDAAIAAGASGDPDIHTHVRAARREAALAADIAGMRAQRVRRLRTRLEEKLLELKGRAS